MKRVLLALAALCIAALPSFAAIGSGSRSQNVTFDGVRLKVETYRPSCAKTGADILFVHHGSSRSTYSSGYKRVADRNCMVVIAPIFPSSSYSSRTYQKGGIVDSRGNLLPESKWTVRLEDDMVAWARGQVGGDPDVYLFGFSAGGQYLSRVAGYEHFDGIARWVIGSPSTHVMPSMSEDPPYGFRGMSDSNLRAYLALPLTIYVGSADDDPNSSDLDKSSDAMRQGKTRLERAQNAFNMGKQAAQQNGWTFNWRLVIARGVGHGGSSMLKAAEVDDAIFGDADTGGGGNPPPPPPPPPTPDPEPCTCPCVCPNQ